MNQIAPISPRMYVGFLLSVREFTQLIINRLTPYLHAIDVPSTVRNNVHNYFYNEALPTQAPMDCFLGGMVCYSINQETLDQSVRSAILYEMADLQWSLHDYISTSIQTYLGQDIVRETEYYYNLDRLGRLMVYVPVSDYARAMLGINTVPEASVVMACYAFLPMEKKLVFSKAIGDVNNPVAKL